MILTRLIDSFVFPFLGCLDYFENDNRENLGFRPLSYRDAAGWESYSNDGDSDSSSSGDGSGAFDTIENR